MYHKHLYCIIIFLLTIVSVGFPQSQQGADVEKQIDALIKKMTLEEKIGMIHGNSSFTTAGVPRLNIPELVMSDGPNGVRLEHGRDWIPDNEGNDSATYLPTGVALAATWNTDLGYAYGKVLGSEARYRGKDVILGPGINILRTPLNGRNFEYLSEDPYLVGKMATGYIKGVQDQEVAACVKHYLANNQETQRNSINVLMSERALREIYLPGFKAAVKEGGVYSLMGAYNKFRGEYCTQSKYLIHDILKGELGFQGIVISDWGAVHNTMEALKYGTDVEMGTELSPSGSNMGLGYDRFFMGDTTIKLIKSGAVPESLVDDKVRRILRVMFKTNMFGKRSPGSFSTKEHQISALKIAEEAIVLLKNTSVLPLKKETIKSIAVIGENAVRKQAEGGGSAQVRAKYEITPLEGIKLAAGSNVKVTYAEGYKIARGMKADTTLIAAAVKAAAAEEVAIVVGGWIHGYTDKWDDNAFDAESVDKPDMQMPFGQNELIEAVIKANPNTIVVLVGGGAVDMSGWGEKAKAIIQAWYGGMEGGTALGEIIFGTVNPSGKLPMTFPKKLEDSPAHKLGEYPGNGTTVTYKEGIFVGYRYFDTYKVEPQFAFGHGLSYTTFDFKNPEILSSNKRATISVTVTNTGKSGGAEVVHVYVKDIQSSVERPEKELKGFKKLFLNPGESKVVEIKLESDAFQFYDENKKQWVLEPGKFEIQIGNSSRNIKLRKEITL
jgi:beta-glucosidase